MDLYRRSLIFSLFRRFSGSIQKWNRNNSNANNDEVSKSWRFLSQVWARRLQVANPSLTIPVSGTITTEQVMKEALARFRLGEDVSQYQLVKVTLEAGRGRMMNLIVLYSAVQINVVKLKPRSRNLCPWLCEQPVCLE